MRSSTRLAALAVAAATLVVAPSSAHAMTATANPAAGKPIVATTVHSRVITTSVIDALAATRAFDTPLPAADKSRILLVATREQAASLRKLARALRIKKVRARIIAVARKQIGDRYVPGMSGPNAFDCSGLTRYIFKVVTGRNLPHYSGAQYRMVKRIPLKKAQPGDLVFFMRNGAHHVGIYIGNHRMIDAPGVGRRVRVSPISGSWWSAHYSGVGRILPAA